MLQQSSFVKLMEGRYDNDEPTHTNFCLPPGVVGRPKRQDTTPPDRTNTALDKAFARRAEMLQFKVKILFDFQIPFFVRKALLGGRYKITGKNQGGKRVPITREDMAGLAVDLAGNRLVGGGGGLVFDAIAIVPVPDTTITGLVPTPTAEPPAHIAQAGGTGDDIPAKPTSALTHSGMPGRPTAKHLYEGRIEAPRQ
ncbi:MAG: hypothetical protein FD149_2447 [Rhodospirillaceae bacterium]|nr:MAG: hypothetical protein FD149_2447 [Rhodospirillaceae bacterium]